jgi:acyl carrier protein
MIWGLREITMNVEEKLREILLPVFGLDKMEYIQPDHSLVKDLGAESLDFVEIVYLIEKNFGVSIETKEMLVGTSDLKVEELFRDGKLTSEGCKMLIKEFPHSKESIKEGMSKITLFSLVTVGDLARIIDSKMLQTG